MRDAKDKANIGLTLNNDLQEHVRGCSAAAEIRNEVGDLFRRETLLSKSKLRRRFYSAKMDDNVKSFLFNARIRQLALDWNAMDVTIDNQKLS